MRTARITVDFKLNKLDPITKELNKIEVIQKGLMEADLISSMVETANEGSRVHIRVFIPSVPVDTLVDNGSAGTPIRKSIWDKIAEVSSR